MKGYSYLRPISEGRITNKKEDQKVIFEQRKRNGTVESKFTGREDEIFSIGREIIISPEKCKLEGASQKKEQVINSNSKMGE